MLIFCFSEWKQERIMNQEFCSSLLDTSFSCHSLHSGGQHLYTLWSLTFPSKNVHDPPNPCYLKTAITSMEEVVLNDCKQPFEKFHFLALYFLLLVYCTWSLLLTRVFIFLYIWPQTRITVEFPCIIASYFKQFEILSNMSKVCVSNTTSRTCRCFSGALFWTMVSTASCSLLGGEGILQRGVTDNKRLWQGERGRKGNKQKRGTEDDWALECCKK